MNFKGKDRTFDCIVSFAPAAADFASVKPGIYKPGDNPIVDKFVFNRDKGAKLNIQASNFEHNRKSQCPKPVDKRDPNPYLRNIMVKSFSGTKHLTHYPENPDTPSYVRQVFGIAGKVIVSQTNHGGYNAACVVNGAIKKVNDGLYSLEPVSLKPVPWTPGAFLFAEQLRITKEAKEYKKQKNTCVAVICDDEND